MKKILIGAILLAGFVTCLAADNRFGIGVIVGEPTGLSAKKWLGDHNALDFAAAWSFSENASFQLHADYLFHYYQVFSLEELKGEFPLYVGIGSRIKMREKNAGKGRNDEDNLIGVRFPLGISYLFKSVPLDLFLEVVPIMDLFPSTDFSLNAALGARFYFR